MEINIDTDRPNSNRKKKVKRNPAITLAIIIPWALVAILLACICLMNMNFGKGIDKLTSGESRVEASVHGRVVNTGPVSADANQGNSVATLRKNPPRHITPNNPAVDVRRDDIGAQQRDSKPERKREPVKKQLPDGELAAIFSLTRAVCGEEAKILELYWRRELPDPLYYRKQDEFAFAKIRLANGNEIYKQFHRDVNWAEFRNEIQKATMSKRKQLVVLASAFNKNWTSSIHLNHGPSHKNWKYQTGKSTLVYTLNDGVIKQIPKLDSNVAIDDDAEKQLENDLESVRRNNRNVFDFITGAVEPNGFNAEANRAPQKKRAPVIRRFDSPLGEVVIEGGPPAGMLETIKNPDGTTTRRLKRK